MELDADYDSLVKVIKPFEIATAPAPKGTSFETAGISLDQIPDKQRYLRRSVCTPAGYDKTVADQLQIWDKEMMFNGCSIRGGASGSGLFHEGKLYGLLHAGAVTDGTGSDPCLNDTCVIEHNKPKKELSNFGYDVTNLHKCYKDCKLNTKLPGCLLPDPESKISVDYKAGAMNNFSLKREYTIMSQFSKFQVKGCTSDPKCSCDDPNGFKTHIGHTITGAPFFEDGKTYEPKPGAPAEMRYLCIRGQNADGTLDYPKNMTKMAIHLKNMKYR